MTTPQQLNLEDGSSEAGLQRQNINAGLDRYSTTTLASGSCEQENTPLLGIVRPRGCFAKVMSRFRSRNCCLRSSKAALLILVWNLIISFGMLGFLDPSWYIALFSETLFSNWVGDYSSAIITITGVVYGFSALLLLFYPLDQSAKKYTNKGSRVKSDKGVAPYSTYIVLTKTKHHERQPLEGWQYNSPLCGHHWKPEIWFLCGVASR